MNVPIDKNMFAAGETFLQFWHVNLRRRPFRAQLTDKAMEKKTARNHADVKSNSLKAAELGIGTGITAGCGRSLVLFCFSLEAPSGTEDVAQHQGSQKRREHNHAR